MQEGVLPDLLSGHDDAIEMLLAMADEYAEILGICTVAGNQSLEKTTLEFRYFLYLNKSAPRH